MRVRGIFLPPLRAPSYGIRLDTRRINQFEQPFGAAARLAARPPWARLTDWALKHGGVSLTERRPMPPMGHSSLIRYRKS